MRAVKLDRYVLALMTRPIAACIAITLIAQVLERVLRIIKELAENGAQYGFVVQLAFTVVPYYLTFSLPASFFIGIFLVVARLGDDNEIDAILASGVSISRFSAPFIALGFGFMLVSLLLFGFLQPYGRYAYQAVFNAAVNAGWNAQLQPEVFVDPGKGFTITADKVSMNGRKVKGVFVRHVFPDGREQITTASGGVLIVSPDGRFVTLQLDKGLQVDRQPGKPAGVAHFENIGAVQPLGANQAMRARGGNEGELTLFELAHELKQPNPVIPKRILAAELYARLVRSLSVPFLPLLAIPLGMAAKRGRRAPGLMLGSILLVGFHHAVQMATSVAYTGQGSAGPAVWGLYFVFTGLSSWLFLFSLKRPGDTPITRAVMTLDAAVQRVRNLFAQEPQGATS